MTPAVKPVSEDLTGLPGADLVRAGLDELHSEELTENALLLLIASPRLRRLGFRIPERPDVPRPYEHQLYDLLEKQYGAAAYSRYNSLLRRIVSFCHAMEQRLKR